MGLSWNPSFITSGEGMAMTAEVVFGAIGGVINFVTFSWLSAFYGFAFWATVIISGLFLICYVINLAQTLGNNYHFFNKMVYGYVFVFAIVYIVAAVLSFVSFVLPGILIYLVLVAFLVDGFFKYKAYKNGDPTQTTSPERTV